MQRIARPAICLALAAATQCAADPPRVVAADARNQGGTWRFDVTVAHPDTGWDHYADGWEVLAPDGARLGYRELLHPHVDEQPFTRSLGGVVIPDHLTGVTIRARDNLEAWSDVPFAVTLPR